jgi:hypothetical protein
MKKLILLGLFISFTASTFAQITLWKDTVEVINLNKPQSNLPLFDTLYNNTNAPITITWNKLSDNLLSGWTGTGICQDGTCFSYDNTPHNFTIPANGKGEIDVMMSIAANATNGCSYVTVEFSEPGVIGKKNIVYKFCTNMTASTKDFTNNNVVTIFPNPASNFINLNILDNKVSNIDVVNIIGKKIAHFEIDASTPNPMRIPLDNIAKGIYLMQFSDNNGKLMGVKRVTKQ